MATLSAKDEKTLKIRGITIANDSFGLQVSLTATGLFWLFNYLLENSKVGATLTLKLLADIAKFKPKDGRSLYCQALPIPVYDTHYIQVAFYLEGSPPRAFHSYPPKITKLANEFSVPVTADGVFKIRNDQTVKIVFSDAELAELNNNKLLIIDKKNLEINL